MTPKRPLQFLFLAVFALLLAGTVRASLDRNLIDALRDLWPDPWFQVTLLDTYFGFLTVWLWIAWREPGIARKLLWAVLIATLGNFAIAGYLLRRLAGLKEGEGVRELLVGRPEA